MKPQNALLIFFGMMIGGSVMLMLWNAVWDPMCFVHCSSVDLDRYTTNRYYSVAQRIVAHPDATAIIVGSSRGESTPAWLVEKMSGLKTVNLSVGGAEMLAKIAFIRIAADHLRLQRILWFADFFEFISADVDMKVRLTPVVRERVIKELDLRPLQVILELLQVNIDHRTLESSFAILTKHQGAVSFDDGPGEVQTTQDCDFPGPEKNELDPDGVELRQNIETDFLTYTQKVMKEKQDPLRWQQFANFLRELRERKVDISIVIPPYQPDFSRRLQFNEPRLYEDHLRWIRWLKGFSNDHTKVFDFFAGLPSDILAPLIWGDGVHFNCRGVRMMLKPVFE